MDVGASTGRPNRDDSLPPKGRVIYHTEAQTRFLERFYTLSDPLEGAFQMEYEGPARYSIGQLISILLEEELYEVTITNVFWFGDRLRYRIQFGNMAVAAITEAVLRHLQGLNPMPVTLPYADSPASWKGKIRRGVRNITRYEETSLPPDKPADTYPRLVRPHTTPPRRKE